MGRIEMRSRAIVDLVQLSESTFFADIAEGLTAIHENAARMAEGIRVLSEGKNYRAARILEALVQEESAKYLMLLDAVRCPRKPAERFKRQLQKFNEHLAKGLYADASNWSPVDFKEIRVNIDRECEEYYLDGPNDIDWIFENWIIRQREEAFYVDYVAEDDGTHQWWSPRRYDLGSFSIMGVPAVYRIANALQVSGVGRREALAIVADIWRPVHIQDSTHFSEIRSLNEKTIEGLSRAGLLLESGAGLRYEICDKWPFPMYDLPMKKTPVNKAKLREVQQRWYPDT